MASSNKFIKEVMNTVPNAHGTFMAQAIQTCQVRWQPGAAVKPGLMCRSAELASALNQTALNQPVLHHQATHQPYTCVPRHIMPAPHP